MNSNLTLSLKAELDRTENEKRILSLIRQAGSLTKADITRLTGLSVQSATTIINRLHADGFLNPCATVRGKIGQPSTPFELHPDGACSIGIKVGRRSLSVITMSFTNALMDEITRQYDYPEYPEIIQSINEDVTTLVSRLSTEQRERFVGLGLATPNMLQEWEGVIGAPKGAMARWEKVDLQEEISRLTGFNVYQLNDASAACLAELAIGNTTRQKSFLYFYIGTFVGGGLMLDGQIYPGKTGNSAAVGSLPTQIYKRGTKAPAQLLQDASLYRLEAVASKNGIHSSVFGDGSVLDKKSQAVFDEWCESAAPALAYAILCGQSFLDHDTIVVDGDLSRDLLYSLVYLINESLTDYDLQGLCLPAVHSGQLGSTAKAMGGATLPIHANFSPSTPT